MAIQYESIPPTEDDVRLDFEFVHSVERGKVAEPDLAAAGFSDTHQFSSDILYDDERSDRSFYTDKDHILERLNAVERGMARAATVLTSNDSRSAYLAGVNKYLSIQVIG